MGKMLQNLLALIWVVSYTKFMKLFTVERYVWICSGYLGKRIANTVGEKVRTDVPGSN